MPIVVPCPGCPAQLSAPESAAGKQIRCPKCKAVAAVPALIAAEEVAVVEAKVSPPAKPRVKPTVADEADDDRPRGRSRRDESADDDEDDRPRRKKRRPVDDEDDAPPRRPRRRKAAKGGGGAVVALVVVGGVLAVVALGAGIYYLTGKGGFLAKKAPVPAGWKQYDYPQSGFKAYFPGEPAEFGANVRGGFGGGDVFGGVEIPQVESMFSYSTGGPFGGGDRSGAGVTVQVTRYGTPIPRASRDLMARNGDVRFGGSEVKRVRWLGTSAVETTAGGVRMRMAVLEKVVVVAQISGPNGARAKPDEEDGFFDNVELTK